MKTLLGGKGANLAEMCKIGLSVPPGFTITTETCRAFHEAGEYFYRFIFFFMFSIFFNSY